MSEKVLIVDDEVGILNALERLLRREKFTIVKAVGGEEGINALERETDIAVIISDQRMPDIPGLEVLKKCRELHPKTVRIALTGYSDVDTILGCLNDAQVSQFLMKPWDDDNLRTIIRHAVANFTNDRERLRLEGVVDKQNEEIRQHNEMLKQKVLEQTKDIRSTRDLLQETLNGVIEALEKMTESHNPGLHGHGSRVAKTARRLAEMLGLTQTQITQIDYASLLHDIGLTSIPVELLMKSETEMNLNERKIFHRHALTGHQLLKEIRVFSVIANIVRGHHEAYDGSGYPDALSGEKIPIGARIIALADALDLFLFPPCRLEIRPFHEAMGYIIKNSGKLFDPAIVELVTQNPGEFESLQELTEAPLLVGQLRSGMVLALPVINLNGKEMIPAGEILTPKSISMLQGNRDIDPVATQITVTVDSFLKADEPVLGLNESKGPASSPEKKNEIKAGFKRKVYVVDDEIYVMQALRRELRREQIDVECFQNPKDVLIALEAPHPDLIAVITDFNMPGIKGDVLISRIHRAHPELPCIVITGEPTKDTIQRLVSLGTVHSILRKPWDKQKLITTLREFKTLYEKGVL